MIEFEKTPKPLRRPKHRLIKAAEEAVAIAAGEKPETKVTAYLNVRLTVGLLEKLDAFAAARGIIRSEAVRLILEERLA